MAFCVKGGLQLAVAVSLCSSSPLAATTVEQIPTIARHCDEGDQRACGQLSKIAVHEKDAEVRRAAVARLGDQSLLAKIALEDWSVSVRSTAVDNLTDQGLLAQIAFKDWSIDVRIAAVTNLTDQGLLSKVSLEATDPGIRSAAVAKLANQSLLAKIVSQDTDAGVRIAAAAKVADQSILAKIAFQDADGRVRFAAVSNLTDQKLLAKVATETTDAVIYHTALTRLTDPLLLAQIVGRNIRSIKARIMRDPITFAPETIKIENGKDGWLKSFQVSPFRTVAADAAQSFMVVEILFEPVHPIELSASDVRLVFAHNQVGASEPLGILGDTTTINYPTSPVPYWGSPENHMGMIISGKRSLSWLFVVGRDSSVGQYTVSVAGTEFDLTGAQE